MRRVLTLLMGLFFFCALNAQEVVRYVTANLNLRESPDVTSSIITQIPKGTAVLIDEDCDCKWIPVSYNGYIGYVSTKYLSKEKVYYSSAPPGATALCRDGTYSFSKSRRGTCSHHGGVAKWLK